MCPCKNNKNNTTNNKCFTKFSTSYFNRECFGRRRMYNSTDQWEEQQKKWNGMTDKIKLILFYLTKLRIHIQNIEISKRKLIEVSESAKLQWNENERKIDFFSFVKKRGKNGNQYNWTIRVYGKSVYKTLEDVYSKYQKN